MTGATTATSHPLTSGQASTSGRTSTSRLRGLDLTVQRRLDGLLHGDHAGLRLGPGSEPEELARYQPGHDVRRIDWNVTARAREPHVWLTQAEHELDTWLLVDQTPSMAFGTVTCEKGQLATTIASALGILTDAPGNRVGLATLTSDGLDWQRPRPGRVAAYGTSRSPGSAREGTASVDLADALNALAARHRRPGLRIVISDLIDPAGEHQRPFTWEQPLCRLARRHDVIMVEIIDPRELQLPDVGLLTLVDPESGRQREVFTGDRRLRTAYADAATAHRLATAEAITAAGAGHLLLRTDHDWVPDLARHIRARRRLPTRRTTPRRR